MQRVLGDLRPFGAVGVGQADLELGADRRQRAAQLVRGGRGEQLLAAGGLLQPVEHAVQRQAQLGDLVVGRAGLHATGQVGGLDAIDLGAHRVDRRQRPADDPPDQPRGERDHQRQTDQQRVAQVPLGARAPSPAT